MAAGVTFRVTGEKQLIAALKELGGGGQRRATKVATSASVLPLKQASKADAPRETGQMRKMLATKVKAYPEKGVVLGIVGVRADAKNAKTGRNPAKYLHLVTKGVKPHNIAPRTKKVLLFKGRYTGRVSHPGQRPNNFLERAFQAGKGAALARFQSKLRERIEAEAKRARKN